MMPYTAEDYQRDFGPGWPDFYTTPADWSACKNLNLEGATPCWHPHCDCQPSEKKSMAFDFIKFLKTIAIAGGVAVMLLFTVGLVTIKLLGGF